MNIQIEVRTNAKALDFKQRVNRGFEGAGAAWKAENQRYPARSSPGSMRTGALGNTAAFEIEVEGRSIVFKAKKYWKFLMYGTGIHGPKGTPIVPVRAKVLAWRTRGGMVFAKKSSGTKWDGKLEKIEDAVIAGFKRGIKEG